MRFFLIDRITEWEPGKKAAAVKCVSLSEDFFQDHFPRFPVMPGALILEGMAQLAGTLLQAGVRLESGRLVLAVMSVVERAKFRRIALPGDNLTYRATVDTFNEMGGKAAVQAYCGEKILAECRLTFVFHELSDPAAIARQSEVLSGWLAASSLSPPGPSSAVDG